MLSDQNVHKRNHEPQGELEPSMEEVIDLVRQVRNGFVKKLLLSEGLQGCFLEEYGRDLSPKNAEFLKRDLAELMISPVDLTHYSILIRNLRDSGINSLSEISKDLFYEELRVIFDKHTY